MVGLIFKSALAALLIVWLVNGILEGAYSTALAPAVLIMIGIILWVLLMVFMRLGDLVRVLQKQKQEP